MKTPPLFSYLITRLAVLFFCTLLAAPAAMAGPRIVSVESVEPEASEELVEEPVEAGPAEAELTPADDGGDTTVVVVSQDRPAPPHMAHHAPRFDPRGFEVGMRLGTFTAGGDWIDADGTANYGGFGLALRWRFVESWSLEFGVDSAFRGTETMDGEASASLSESRSLVNFGALTYFGEPDWGQSYMSFGILASSVDITGPNADESSYGEGGIYAGIGGDIYLGDAWRLNSELRLAVLGRDDEDTDIVPLPEGSYISGREAPDGRVAAQWFISMLYSF